MKLVTSTRVFGLRRGWPKHPFRVIAAVALMAGAAAPVDVSFKFLFLLGALELLWDL